LQTSFDPSFVELRDSLIAVRAWLSLVLVAVLLASGCAEECRDADGDGRGEGCEAGPDCDDDNRRLGERCDQLAHACAEDRIAEGCPCLAGARLACYSGAEETLDVGMCHAGMKRCVREAWGACEGEVSPRRERCDANDDDCDGLIDEGVLSPCGGCDSTCGGGVWGPPTAPFAAEGELALTVLGELTLARARVAHELVWLPNTGDGTLSKVDAGRARELARYRVGGEPERIAVDHLGDAWVLSPGLETPSQLSKISADVERCVDRDGDGLQTSGAPEELLVLGADDCVLWSVEVGAAGALARALAIDGALAPALGSGALAPASDPGADDVAFGGNAWVGLQQGARLLQIDGRDGSVLREVETPGLAPYAAAFDPWGQLWVIDRAGLLARFDPRPGGPELELLSAPLRCYELESLASDLEGVLNMTGFACEDVISYDPARGIWRSAKTPDVLDTRGIALLEDAWITHTGGLVSRVQRDPLIVGGSFSLRSEGSSPIESTAISADAAGQLWIASSMGGGGERGVLTRFDPAAEAVSAQVPVGRLPRVQGDLTGDRLFGLQAAEASAEHVFLGCGGAGADAGSVSTGTLWKRVHVAYRAGEGASVQLEVRRADDRDGLDGEPYATLGSAPEDPLPYALDVPDGGVLQVRVTLRAQSRLGAPRITRVGVEWTCPGPE